MALQPPLIAPQAASSGLTSYSPKGCRCGFTQFSAPFCLHREKCQIFLRVHPTYSFNGQGRNIYSAGVAPGQPFQAFSSALGEVATSGIAGGDGTLKEPVKSVSMQVEQMELPPSSVEGVLVPQEARSMVSGLATLNPEVQGLNDPSGFTTIYATAGVEGLNEPSGSATLDPNAIDGTSVAALAPPQPGATSFDQSPNLETLRSNAEESISATAAAGTTDALSTDQFKSAKEAYEAMLSGNTASTAAGSQEAADTATDALSTDQFKSAKEAYEAMLSGPQDATDQGASVDPLSQASQSLSQASQSILSGLSEAKTAVMNGLTSVQESVQSSVDNASMAVKTAYDNINGSIITSLKHVTGLDGGSRTVSEPTANVAIQESLLKILKSPFQMGTPVNNALKVFVTAVEDIAGKVLVGAGELAASGYTSTKEVLPSNAKVYLSGIERKLIEISGPLESVLKQVYTFILDAEKTMGINPENPVIPIVLFIGGSFSLGILYLQLQYGGYSGDLAPALALDLLKEEANIVLIDLRPEVLRENEGIPDLRRQARFKIASIEQFKVQGSFQKMLKNAADAEAALTATAIKNLKNVKFNTKVVLLDSDGSQSKSIARALKKAGIKMPYRIDGGFRAWEAGGLRIKQLGAETPLTFIKEETEAIFDEVKPTPSGITVATLGVFAGIYALIEWEKTLQFLGLVCIGQVLYTRLNSYETVDDAKNDLKLLLRPFAFATQGVVWAAGALEPSKLQLATSPSTSAVQDRVLQAAAKHGPLPSEHDQELQEAQPLEGLSSKEPEDDSIVQD